MTSRPIAIYYEEPDWFRPLFAELDARGINYVKLNAACLSFDPAAARPDFSLFFNRMSASAYLRGNGEAIFFTHSYLAYLETAGVRVLNGSPMVLNENDLRARPRSEAAILRRRCLLARCVQ